MKVFVCGPKGICASKILIGISGEKVESVNIIGGCPGNSMGVSRLCVGRSIDEVIVILDGIDCRGRGISCPDQLAKALIKFREEELVKQ